MNVRVYLGTTTSSKVNVVTVIKPGKSNSIHNNTVVCKATYVVKVN